MSDQAERTVVVKNPKLATLERMDIDGSCAVLPMDIFDPSLWRRVPRPTDIFAVLGARLQREGTSP